MSDFVLVPSAPFNIELRVSKIVRRMVHAAGKRSKIVLVKTTSPTARRTRKVISDYPDHFAPTALRYLVGYPDSYARGEGVMESFPGSVAAAEVLALHGYLMQELGIDRG